jgi:hypothetical protein
MTLNFNKVTSSLVLPLLLSLSLNLTASEAQNETNVQDDYYYLPPHQFKNFNDLTVTEQKKAQELDFDRQKFTQWLIQSNPNTPKWADFEANTTK